MPELHESSGLVSLASLREHEKRQAHQLAEAARARAEAEQRARLEAERDAARAEHERRRAERAAQEFAESAQRAEELRREALERAESEHRAALSRSNEELEHQLSSEREARRTCELGLTTQLLRQRLLTSLASALCVGTCLGAITLYFGALRPAADRALDAAQQSLLAEQRGHGESEANSARLARRAEDLAARVEALEQRLRETSALVQSPTSAQPTPHRPGWKPPPIPPPQKPCRDDGDPLNPCLKH